MIIFHQQISLVDYLLNRQYIYIYIYIYISLIQIINSKWSKIETCVTPIFCFNNCELLLFILTVCFQDNNILV